MGEDQPGEDQPGEESATGMGMGWQTHCPLPRNSQRLSAVTVGFLEGFP